LAMTYGYEVSGRSDRRIDAARKLAEVGTATALPGALLVNGLPFRAFFLSGTASSTHDNFSQFGTSLSGCRGLATSRLLVTAMTSGSRSGMNRSSSLEMEW
jgi:hypothetical protein